MADEPETEDESKKKMVGTRVSEERFDRWTEAIEESNEITSKAQAIRIGVEQLLFSDDSEANTGVDSEQILSRLDEIEQDIAEVRGDVITTRKEIPSVDDIAEEVIWKREDLADIELGRSEPETPYEDESGQY